MSMISREGETGLNLIPVNPAEKKEFLSRYMSFRMELEGMNVELSEVWSEDRLSRFWNEPERNHLLWIKDGERKIGFAAVSVESPGNAILCGLFLNREERGKGLGKAALGSLFNFSRYRGISNLSVGFLKAPRELLEFFRKAGFSGDGMSLSKRL
ncbi:hypothetical protein B6U90_06185 [Thermoplasmatales archaeon ex4484_6]|nr:MAG: hypothetical protein B6U90_06185 [Thermoplasmatales archaeon ex4484_6]RLF68719.1 MAG: hypothetical protein DRN57_03120 [Thermoplasmata archaeon]